MTARPADGAGRVVTVAAAQMGPVQPDATREHTLGRMTALLEEAAQLGAELVAYPEAALTPFFPHWSIDDPAELDAYFEPEMPNPLVAPFLARAAELGAGVSFGYCELDRSQGVTRRFNSSILVDPEGGVVGRYRKVHLPGTTDVQPGHPFQNLEKRYFSPGDGGFPVWEAFSGRVGMCICNDRRWPESFRVLGLLGAELVLVGYNTPAHNPAEPSTDRHAEAQNLLSLRAGAYHNGMWVVGVAKAGVEAGVEQIAGTSIVAPSGEVIASATTTGDEIVLAACDLDECRVYRENVFGLATNRRPDTYGPITRGA